MRAERLVKEAEKMITDAEARGDEDAKRALRSITRFLKGQIEYSKTINDVKTSFQSFDIVTSSDMVKRVLAKINCSRLHAPNDQFWDFEST